MIRPHRRVLTLAAAVALAIPVGCLSRSYPEKQQYMVQVERVALPPVGAAPPTHAGAAAAQAAGVLRVGRLRVAPQFERRGFVYRTGETTYERDFYNEFFEPPSVLFRQATGGWLAESPVFSSVIGATDPDAADWLLEGRIDALYGDVREKGAAASVFRITFTLFDNRSPALEPVFKKTYAEEIPAARASAAAILAAWNEALTRVLAQLETDLEGQLSAPPRG